MIEKDELPIEAVQPSASQRDFLKRIIRETTEYARSKSYNDMYFQGHGDHNYFGAYSTKAIHRGAGKFVFGFDRRGGLLRFAFPIEISEPYRLAKAWVGDPTRNRAVIDVAEIPDEEIQLYLIDVAKRSIDYHYND